MTAQPEVENPRYRFTVTDYYNMARAGVFADDDRVELLDGEVVAMVPIVPTHASTVDRLVSLFVPRISRERAVVRVQNPLQLDEHSEPEPDVVLARPRPGLYSASHPGPDDALLVVEVAESSLTTDRERKIPLYAAADVHEVWIIDVEHRILHVYRSPHHGEYTEIRQIKPGDTIAPLAFADVGLNVSELIG